MYNQSFICTDPPQTDSFISNTSVFRYYELDDNCLFKTDDKEYVYLFYLLEGEIKINGINHSREVVRSGEFFFITNSDFICRSTKRSDFILFSINKYHFCNNRNHYYEILPVISAQKKQKLPFMAPRLLSAFMENIKYYLKKGFNNPSIQEVKKRELFFLLNSLYSKVNTVDIWMYGFLSLS